MLKILGFMIAASVAGPGATVPFHFAAGWHDAISGDALPLLFLPASGRCLVNCAIPPEVPPQSETPKGGFFTAALPQCRGTKSAGHLIRF